MTELIIGPPGVLAPGVDYICRENPGKGILGRKVWLLEQSNGEVRYYVHSLQREYTSTAEGLCLDLTGDLGLACRALLHLVAPDVPQPDCAPGWRAVAQAGGVTRWGLWVGVSMVWTFDCAETNPRRALAMALEAAAGGER